MPSKIAETTKNIKKKLSFNDVKLDHKTSLENQKIEDDPKSKFSQEKKTSQMISAHTNNEPPEKPKNNPGLISDLSLQSQQQYATDYLEVHQESDNSIEQIEEKKKSTLPSSKKGTYYLPEKTFKQIDEMFIKWMIAGSKKDKSQLVCEAVDLLYNSEFVKNNKD